MLDKFTEQWKQDQQQLFREKEVQSLRDLIYGTIESEQTTGDEDEFIVDTSRYDVHPSKLEIYTQPDIKRVLKTKFVTGQSQEQIMKNLLNMGDSDEEEEKPKRKGRHGKKEESEPEADGDEDSEEETKKPGNSD